MPKQYQVQAPDGKVITLEGPEGATDEEVIAQAQLLYKPEPSSPADTRTAGQVALDQLKNVATGIPQAITGIPSGIGAALSGNAMDLLRGIGSTLSPVTTSLQGAGALIAPNTIPAPSREQFEQAAQAAGANLGGLLLAKGAPAAIGKIPTTEAAAAKFQQVMNVAGNVPVDITQALQIARDAAQLRQYGHPPPAAALRALEKLAGPTNMPNTLTYSVTKKVAEAAGAQSAREITALNTQQQAKVGQFYDALKSANRDAAAKVGMGQLYDEAMKEYRQAKTLEDVSKFAVKWGRNTVFAALLGSGAKAGANLFDIISGR